MAANLGVCKIEEREVNAATVPKPFGFSAGKKLAK
jgi:hypothetical protein